MSFKFGSLKFIDSFQFMASSLEKLVEMLYDNTDKYANFPRMKQYFKEDMDILCRKGFYPYEFVDSDDKLKLFRATTKIIFLFKIITIKYF